MYQLDRIVFCLSFLTSLVLCLPSGQHALSKRQSTNGNWTLPNVIGNFTEFEVGNFTMFNVEIGNFTIMDVTNGNLTLLVVNNTTMIGQVTTLIAGGTTETAFIFNNTVTATLEDGSTITDIAYITVPILPTATLDAYAETDPNDKLRKRLFDLFNGPSPTPS